MERKHQVFVSSTYQDLIEERKEVIHALLELDCIPAGMELFPAADEDAWSLIREIIDGCDYYVLILAGKYGSTNREGISFTEMEYDYAVYIGKPVIAFLHESPDDLVASKRESSEEKKTRLSAFREKAKGRHCKYWSNAHDLGGKVSRSMVQLKKRHPSDGWVPGRYAADQRMLNDIEKMRMRIAELERELISVSCPPANLQELAHGDESYSMSVALYTDSAKKQRKEITLSPTWDMLFSYCGPKLVGECTTDELLEQIQLAYWHSVPRQFEPFNSFNDIVVLQVVIDQIIVQFQALGLMAPGTKKRTVSDTHTYWKLTSYGETYLVHIRALRTSKIQSDKCNTLDI